jgi:hypothetical protein
MLNSSSRKFEFVTINGQPSKAASDASRRKLVRTNAKRYSLESHSLPIDSQPRAGDISAYTGRFHLKVVPNKENEEVKRGSPSQKNKHVASRLSESDNDRNEKVMAVRRLQQDRSLSRSLDASKLDPYETLSIKIGAQEELLFQYGKLTQGGQTRY